MGQVTAELWARASGHVNQFGGAGSPIYQWSGGDYIVATDAFVNHFAGNLTLVGDQFEVGVHRLEVVDFREEAGEYLLRRVGFTHAVQ